MAFEKIGRVAANTGATWKNPAEELKTGEKQKPLKLATHPDSCPIIAINQ